MVLSIQVIFRQTYSTYNWSNGNEGVLYISQISTTGASPPDAV